MSVAEMTVEEFADKVTSNSSKEGKLAEKMLQASFRSTGKVESYTINDAEDMGDEVDISFSVDFDENNKYSIVGHLTLSEAKIKKPGPCNPDDFYDLTLLIDDGDSEKSITFAAAANYIKKLNDAAGDGAGGEGSGNMAKVPAGIKTRNKNKGVERVQRAVEACQGTYRVKPVDDPQAGIGMVMQLGPNVLYISNSYIRNNTTGEVIYSFSNKENDKNKLNAFKSYMDKLVKTIKVSEEKQLTIAELVPIIYQISFDLRQTPLTARQVKMLSERIERKYIDRMIRRYGAR